MSTRIPISRGNINSDWNLTDVHSGMDTRRKEWEKEIEKMRSDFFTMSPSQSMTNQQTQKFDDVKAVIEQGPDGRPMYRAMFDLHDYNAEGINVKTDDSKFIVTAKRQIKEGNTTVTKEYNKQTDLPPEIDPMSLTCTMSAEGMLIVEALIPTPTYRSGQSTTSQANNTSYSSPTSSLKTRPKVENIQVKEKSTADDQTRVTRPIFSDATISANTFAPTYTSSPAKTEFSQSPITVDRNRRTYTIEVDIEDFKPEELNVKTIDGKLIVTATREDKTGSRTSTKQMTREFTIPSDVDPTTVKAFFTESGKLLIEAPYRM